MKKYLTLIFALLCSATLFAEVNNTFRFVDKNGKVYEDGSVLNLTEIEMSPYGDWQIPTGLYLENTGKTSQNVNVVLDITSISEESSIQFCLLMQCAMYGEVGTFTKTGVESAGTKDDLMLEWLAPYDEDEETGDKTPKTGSAMATLQVQMLNGDGSLFAMGPTITLKFSYDPTQGINGVSADKATVVARYNAAGQQISTAEKGLNIVRLSNGKTIKQINK